MKKLFLITILAIVFLNGQSKDWVNINSAQPVSADIILFSSQITQSTIHFNLNGFWRNIIETKRGEAWLVSVENGAPSISLGAPDLPIFSSSIVVPDMAHMKVNLLSSNYIEYHNVLLAPSKGNLTRDIDPATVPFEFGSVYEVDDFFPGELAKLNEPYIIRDVRGQAIHFQPFQYNPVTKILRVYTNIKIEVVEDGISTVNVIEDRNENSKMDNEFIKIYNQHFLNFNSASRYDPVGEHGNMLIISYADFMDEMQDFIDWKTMTGMPVEIVDEASIGNAAAIKQYIADYYSDNGLTFVLLVGDAAQVPSSYSNGDSDVNYSYVVGNDHYPDLFIGRFSAENETQVLTQVQRTIDYERYPNENETDWYTKCMSIGSNQGPGDDGEMDYDHLRNISDNKLIPFTYDYVYEYFDGSQGGNDASGNPSASAVGIGIDEGVTVINYTGHGSTTSWSSSGFSNSNVNQLSNNGKLPFIISVACVNGNFVNSTCFAETWLRAEDSGEPTGAIATIMSTINQSWDPPMRGQDEMADILTEADENNIKRTFGGITMNGCMGMNDTYGSGGYEMTDTWTIFGDPSVVVRTAVPMDLSVSHPDGILFGMTSFTINCNMDDAIAALSVDGELLGSAIVDGGEATVEFNAFETEASVDIVVTAFNHKPYITSIQVISDGIYARFTADDVDVCTGNSVVYENQSLGSNTSWEWTFEGGTPATYSGEVPPPVVYETAGIYDVTLEVSDGVETDIEIKENYITVLNNVMADFDTDITTGDAPLTIQFNDLSSEDVDSWHWDFGNGGTSGLQNPTYSYYQTGTFTVTLTVEGNGCENTVVKEDYITVTAAAPEPDFTSDNTYGPVPFTVNFTDMSDGLVDTWLWDFGDGNTSDQQNPEHIFTDEDYFDVSLTVTGPGGTETMIKEDFINTLNLVSVTVSASPEDICVMQSTELNAEATGGSETYTYSWTSDPEGFVSDEQNPMVSPEVTTTYMVEVTDGEQVVNGEVEVTVNLLPEISLGDWPEQLCNQQEPPVQLTATPEGGTYSGNHVTAEGVFSPEEATVGWHVITYTYEDENGCENMKQDSVFVDACLSFGENGSENSSIIIYPNPFNDILNIKTTLKDIKVKVMTLDGKTIMDIDLMENNTSVDLSQLNSGIYIVYFENAQTNTFQKIIKR